MRHYCCHHQQLLVHSHNCKWKHPQRWLRMEHQQRWKIQQQSNSLFEL